MTELVQTAINIGAKHGNISAKKLLPSRNTVKRKLDEEATVVKSKIVANTKIVVQENGIVTYANSPFFSIHAMQADYGIMLS